MHPDFAPKLARLLTSHTVPVQKGDFVVISTTTEAIPFVEALAAAVLERGGVPHMALNLPLWEEYFVQHADDDQLAFVNPLAIAATEQADILYNIDAPAHTSILASVPPERIAKYAFPGAWQSVFMRRLGAGELRWNTCAWPTPARAQQANMSFYAYQDFLYHAYGLHLEDPTAYWITMGERQGRIVEWLMQKERIEVRGPGIDLSFACAGRTWYSAHGVGNLPDGEILTCPLEDSVNGSVSFSYPAYHRGKRVDGVRLTFKDGVVVEASATNGEDYLIMQLDSDEGARRMGEFAIGTNDFIQTVTGSVLLDEKIGGTVHMALGASAAPNEGKVTSKIHWDIVHNMREGGEIYADGELFYRSGKFLID